ncbi:E3 ubiquitin-protein ligase SHPRH [Coccinella septempunctata]|uniref:E3 ubiquitin-protein ligase SHPRH n=1 Tax=Coccinella septempunctata TaxID=41139 RepID=UPI001D0627E7|nr:E3 ubiquitin-protein ligase SHPRH [Coccinella septempunctata]
MVRKKVQAVRCNVNIPKSRKPRTPTIKSTPLSTTCDENLLIGKILVGTTLNYPPENWMKCRVSFLCVTDEVDRIHLEFDEISVIVTLIMDTELLKEIFTANVFSFRFLLVQQDLFMNIYFRELPLPKFNTRIGNSLKTVLEITHSISLSSSECPLETLEDDNIPQKLYGVQEIDNLYTQLSTRRCDPATFDSDNVQLPSLKPILRPYQVNAVKWMIKREKNVEEEEDYLHPLYMVVKLPSGKELFFDKFSGHVTPIKPVVSCSSRGGILAEEMGLGKTVEFLALILNNPFNNNQDEKQQDSKILVEGDDSEELSDNDNIDLPVFKKQSKKKAPRKRIKLTPKDDKNVEYSARDIQVPQDWVKTSAKKQKNWVALQLWYNKSLSEVNHKPHKPVETIHCICGETFNKSGQIKCVDCGKIQHKECLGYEKRLGEYRCPSCWLEYPLIESGATLIVTPVSLRTQWCNEIKKHVDKKLKVLVYEGSNKTPVYPTYFKDFDVVITTYSVLQAEFRLTEKGKVCELRRKRKYDFQGSPLSRIKWWRLCLDEAQTVETPGRIVSEMAKKLTAHIRWAVSGTPISKDIRDLFGMVDYLQIEPYNEEDTWKNLLYTPYMNGNIEPLCSFLSKIMWRSTKAEVIDQIGIPKQVVKEHFLEFSAVEKFFYNKEHELCSIAFLATLKNINTNIPLVKLDRSLLKKIMVPLLSLRQVCTHPSTERGKYLATKKQVSTMKDLLEALILKNTNESEELLRVVVSSLNGLAGIHLLMQNPAQAADEYRKVMHLSARFSEEKSENNLTVDKLQLIHTMHNLADLLEKNVGIPPTLHDDTLRHDCEILEQKYIQKFIHNSFVAYQESINSQLAIEKLQNQFSLKEGEWFSEGFDWVLMENFTDELRNRIQNNHDIAHIKCPIDLGCERRMLYFIARWNEEVIDYRAELINTINGLFTCKENEEYKIIIDHIIVRKATDCHLRPDEMDIGRRRKKCPLCSAEDFLKKYEFKIFQMTKRTVTFEDMSLQGSWKLTSQEIILKTLHTFLRAKNAPSALVKDGEIHLNILDNIKKEFKELRKLWTHIYQQVAAQDELDMCKIKLRLEDPSKDKKNSKNSALKRLSYIVENKLDTMYHLNEYELDYHMMLLKSDESTSSKKLEKNLGVRSYLETLRKQQYEGVSPDPCPICTNVLDQHWSILPCGHSYCMECLHNLIHKTGGLHINCCVCRQPIVIQDISYIRSAAMKNDDENFNIRGNFSTKIEATIKLIFELRDEDENVKILVFSSWLAVLKVLKEALVKNEIKTEILLANKLEERIEHFKDEKEKVTALLLPINLGGKGLNLTEATHVILMEPLLNPGEELQAIGRVHRIGQTKPTFVHKFCIRNTIEESIMTATSRDADKWDRNKVTLEQLKLLFENIDIYENNDDDDDNENEHAENNTAEIEAGNVSSESNSYQE